MATNEEKALDIALQLWSGNEMNGDVIRGIATMAAVKMADWKDQQFQEEKKQWIEKVVEWVCLNAELYGGFNPNQLNIMVEKLKQAMNE